MKKPITEQDWQELPPRLRRSFAPLDKLALGLAFGLYCGAALFLVTAYNLLLSDFLIANVDHLASREYSGSYLWLLENYFRGYDPTSWLGALIGTAWASASGFVMGWFLAFARNTFLATWLFVVRIRQNLAANRGFLDRL